ncbi:MAG: DUF4065 domain-containing protein [Chlorobiaceae bacterium]|nr:DUF4065 domain-containing protein [Chlorobiaceae bacterium]NTV59872.1 DUF4065 domain-containing protein [Chlorobiaceae bacterium]
MKSPITGKEMTLEREQRTMSFRKKEYKVCYHYFLCIDTKEQFTTTELDEVNLVQVYNQYRDEHNLPFPEEIISIRDSYGLSAAKMAEVLGFGTNTYRNYEQGEVPSESNARLIQLAREPEEFQKLVQLSGVLHGKQLERLSARIEEMIERRKKTACIDLEEYLTGSKLPDEYSGYAKPSLEKLAEMVVFFAGRMKPWKTKLNKLLFYADFLHFKNTGFSISGTRYCAIDMGPVPDNFNSIFEWMKKKGDIRIHEKQFGDGGTGEQFLPAAERKFRAILFSQKELAAMNTVADRFFKTGTKEIIDISHHESAWFENERDVQKSVSYLRYAFELKAL